MLEEIEEELGTYEALQLLALKEYLDPTEEGFQRKLCRFFSITFHTSIFEAEKKPIEYLLQHYLEYSLEQMSKEDLEKHKKYLLNKEEVLDAEEDDEEFAQMLELKYLREQQEKLKKTKEKAAPITPPPDIKMSF